MLITEKVILKINTSNYKWIQEKGYNITKDDIHKEIEVNVKDLAPSSVSLLVIKCDICGKKFTRKYNDYRRRQENDWSGIDCCKDCKYQKIQIKKQIKFENNKLTKDMPGYYSYKENRLTALRSYIEKYKSIDKMKDNEEGLKLYAVLKSYDEIVWKMALELGYKLENIMVNKPKEYYEDYNILVRDVEEIIKKHGIMPQFNILAKELKISGKTLGSLGGIYELKRKMNYKDDTDLIDDNNYYNASSYEYIVSQWLIHNNIPYKRNVIIEPSEGKYNCDYVIYPLNEEPIWIEVWGGIDHDDYFDYKESHRIKKQIYKKYNKHLISIYPKLFNKTYAKIDKELYKLFISFINKKFIPVPIEKFIPPCKMSDQQIFEELMKHSENQNYLPPLVGINSSIVREIHKRYGIYSNFADKFNKKLYYQANGFWNEQEIFNIFAHMQSKYGKILNRGEINRVVKDEDDKRKYNLLRSVIHKYGGVEKVKIDYIQHCVNNNIRMPENDIKWLVSFVKCSHSNAKNKSLYNDLVEIGKSILSQIEEIYNLILYKTEEKTDMWNNERIFALFDDMINKYGKIITDFKRKDYKEIDYLKFYYHITNSRLSLINLRLEYYNDCLNKNKIIEENDITYINVILTKKCNFKKSITPAQQQQAKEILEKLNLI
jgi:hypothetical protein